MAARAPDPLRIIIVVAVLAAVGLRVHYWLSGPARPRLMRGTGVIAGQVINADGTPAARAGVYARTESMMLGYGAARTDDEGRFTIANLAPAMYGLDAGGRGFLQGRLGEIVPGVGRGAVRLGNGERRDDLTIVRWPAATISGRVLDESGRTKPDCPVRALRTSDAVERYTLDGFRAPMLLSSSPTAKTGSDGVYRLADVMPGEYVIAATCGAKPMRVAYYPSATRFRDATRLTVGVGEDRGSIDVRDVAMRVGAIGGRVELAGAGVVAQMSVLPAAHAEARRELRAASSKDGTFRFDDLPADDYLVRAHVDNGTDHFWAMSPVTVAAGKEVVVPLSLRRGGTVAIDTTIGNVPKAASPQEARAYLGVIPTDRASAAWLAELGSFQDDVQDTGGRLTLTGLPPATYLLRVSHATGRLDSLVVDGRDSIDTPLTVGPDSLHQGRATIVASLAEIGGRILGPVAPVAGIVVIFPVDPALRNPPRRVQAQRVNPDGTYLFGNLPSGEYFVAFSAEVAVPSWTPAWYEAMTASAARVTIAPGERKPADLTIR